MIIFYGSKDFVSPWNTVLEDAKTSVWQTFRDCFMSIFCDTGMKMVKLSDVTATIISTK